MNAFTFTCIICVFFYILYCIVYHVCWTETVDREVEAEGEW